MNVIHIPDALLQLSALIGVVFPLLVALIKQDHLSQKVNIGITVGLSIVAAIITAAAQAKLNVHDIVGSFMALYISAHVFYEGFWKPVGVTPAIQSATSTAPAKAKTTRKRTTTRTQAGQSALTVLLIVLIILCFGFGFVVKWLFIVAIVLIVAALLEGLVWHRRP